MKENNKTDRNKIVASKEPKEPKEPKEIIEPKEIEKIKVSKEKKIENKEAEVKVKDIAENVNSLKDRIILVNVGTPEDPASDEDIENVREKFEKLLEDHNIKCLVYVTHHAVSIKIVG